MSEKCHICNSYEIKHYRQLRRDGVWVVTARCENGHIPIKGKPFYLVALFDVDKLPVLPSQDGDTKQVDMFKYQPQKQEQIKKYPSLPIPPPTGRNFPLPIEEK